MTPLEDAPEHRWRRTVDRRDRPAKLKVDRLLRDFGYAELSPDVGDAIEARLAGVSLAVAPSLRHATVDEVVTIYLDARPPPAAAPGDAPAVSAVEPAVAAVAADVGQMVTYLKQHVLDARAEAQRLRTELDRRIGERGHSESEAQSIIAEQAAALQEQSRQIADLGAALDATRQALAETRDEIRRAVGELQALPELATDPPSPAEQDGAHADGQFAVAGDESAGGSAEETDWQALASRPDELVPDDAAAVAPHVSAAEDEPAPSAVNGHAGFAPPASAPAEGEQVLAATPDQPALDPVDMPPPVNAEPPAGAAAPAPDQAPVPGDPPSDDDALTDFDDFLYERDELFVPGEPAPDDAVDGPPPDAAWPAETGPEVRVVADRPTLGKVLRGRGGRGRWQGTCAICGRVPLESRRRDLEAAGWNIDDEAPACPQCRGLA